MAIEVPKKPKKPDSVDIGRAMLRRKNILITKRRAIPRGDYATVLKSAEDFAKAEGVEVDELKSAWHFGGIHWTIRRRETDIEKEKRIRADLNVRYILKKMEYDSAMRQKRLMEEFERAQHCPENCSCRRVDKQSSEW
jgi:hypothetical protein